MKSFLCVPSFALFGLTTIIPTLAHDAPQLRGNGHSKKRRLVSNTVIISEIMYNPSACSDSIGEWIELFNNGGSEVNLGGWSIADSASSSILSSVVLAPGDYYIIGRTTDGCGGLNADETFAFSLNNGGGDTITLRDGTNSLVDQHTYSEAAASAGHTTQRSVDPSGRPTDAWEQGLAGGSPRGGFSHVMITEIMYNPSACSDSTGEWIELYNAGSVSANLNGWTVQDTSGFVTLPSHDLSPGGYYILARSMSGCGDLNAQITFAFSLNNSGETVSLKDASGNLVDDHYYDSNAAAAGHSTARGTDTSGNPTQTWAEGPSGGTPGSGYGTQSSTPAPAPSPTSATRTYTAFELELSCGTSAGYATRFTYELVGPDTANAARLHNFLYDSALSQACQQTSQTSYSHPNCGSSGRKTNPFCFDRGHLVAANHLDVSDEIIAETNYMTNILPQAAGFNQNGGAWFQTERIIECGRDISGVEKQVIFGGALFSDISNDYFLNSHGIPTPETFWKVVVRYFTDNSTPEVIAWVMPNEHTSTNDKLDTTYLTSIAAVQALVPNDVMPELPGTYLESAATAGASWSIPSGCDVSQ